MHHIASSFILCRMLQSTVLGFSLFRLSSLISLWKLWWTRWHNLRLQKDAKYSIILCATISFSKEEARLLNYAFFRGGGGNFLRIKINRSSDEVTDWITGKSGQGQKYFSATRPAGAETRLASHPKETLKFYSGSKTVRSWSWPCVSIQQWG